MPAQPYVGMPARAPRCGPQRSESPAAADSDLVFFSTLGELKRPTQGPMEEAGVVKLREPFPDIPAVQARVCASSLRTADVPATIAERFLSRLPVGL